MSVIISIGIKSSLLDVVLFVFFFLNRSSSYLQQECLNKAHFQMDSLSLPAIG